MVCQLLRFLSLFLHVSPLSLSFYISFSLSLFFLSLSILSLSPATFSESSPWVQTWGSAYKPFSRGKRFTEQFWEGNKQVRGSHRHLIILRFEHWVYFKKITDSTLPDSSSLVSTLPYTATEILNALQMLQFFGSAFHIQESPFKK